MENLIRIGMDTSKSVFQLHGVNEAEQPALRKKLRRNQVLAFFAGLSPLKIGMEACGAAHYWARELRALGHEVMLLPLRRGSICGGGSKRVWPWLQALIVRTPQARSGSAGQQAGADRVETDGQWRA